MIAPEFVGAFGAMCAALALAGLADLLLFWWRVERARRKDRANAPRVIADAFG